MKRLLVVSTLLALSLALVVEARDADPDPWPDTVDGAVANLLAVLSEEDKAQVRSTSKDDLILFHFGWGTGIRNRFGLWRGNTGLAEAACGKGCHLDEVSMVIIEATWSALQKGGGDSDAGEDQDTSGLDSLGMQLANFRAMPVGNPSPTPVPCPTQSSLAGYVGLARQDLHRLLGRPDGINPLTSRHWYKLTHPLPSNIRGGGFCTIGFLFNDIDVVENVAVSIAM